LRKKVTAAFDGGRLSSDSGMMLLALAAKPVTQLSARPELIPYTVRLKYLIHRPLLRGQYDPKTEGKHGSCNNGEHEGAHGSLQVEMAFAF
jgi:hypothetical protein